VGDLGRAEWVPKVLSRMKRYGPFMMGHWQLPEFFAGAYVRLSRGWEGVQMRVPGNSMGNPYDTASPESVQGATMLDQNATSRKGNGSAKHIMETYYGVSDTQGTVCTPGQHVIMCTSA